MRKPHDINEGERYAYQDQRASVWCVEILHSGIPASAPADKRYRYIPSAEVKRLPAGSQVINVANGEIMESSRSAKGMPRLKIINGVCGENFNPHGQIVGRLCLFLLKLAD